MGYSKEVIDHYENPRNVGSFDKDGDDIGTGIVGAPACLHPDTLIAVADGRKYTSIKELSKESEVPVYSYDDEKGIIVKKATCIRKTGIDKKIVKITLDDESCIFCTPDHLLRTRSSINKWIKASELSSGLSLMPFYFKDEVKNYNHKVVSLELVENSDVYCMFVEDINNFAIITQTSKSHNTGVIVHNCGDVMKLQIKVKDGVIKDAKFKTFGCGSAIASSSLITEWVKGMTIEKAMKIENKEIVKELSLPPVKIHCSVLAEDAIKAAIKDYQNKEVIELTLEDIEFIEE